MHVVAGPGTRGAGRPCPPRRLDRLRQNQVGEWPGLAQGLDPLGNVKTTSDFRSVYCSLFEQWLGFEAGGVIPRAPEPLRASAAEPWGERSRLAAMEECWVGGPASLAQVERIGLRCAPGGQLGL